MIQFEIDGNSFADPENWQDISERVYFSPDVLGYLYEVNGKLGFGSGAYAYLRGLFFENGCNVVPCVITIDGRVVNVNIFLNDVIWSLDDCVASVEFVDNTYTSYIENNKEIKAYLNVPRSKNDVDISAYTTVTTGCSFLGYETGVDTTSTGREGIRLYDAFKFMIAFISDGEMDFDSIYMATESDPALPSNNRNPTLFDPAEIRNGGGSAHPYISFEDLISDTYSMYNVHFGIEMQANGRPLFRIEQPEYFRTSTSGITIDNARGVKQQSDVSKFYQLVKIGSAEVLDTHPYYDPIQLFSWNQEEYHLGGKCNNQSILDIQNVTIISDTNIIQDALPIPSGGSDSDSFDGDVVIVVLDGDNVTIPSPNPTNGAFQNYNFLLKNDEILDRFYGAIPQSIFLFLGEGDNDARSEQQSTTSVGSATVITNPVFNTIGTYAQFVDFPVETTDPNNNMRIDPTTFGFDGTLTQSNVRIFESPVAGVYDVLFELRNSGLDWQSQNGAVYLMVYNTSSQLVPERVFPFGDNFGDEADLIPILQGQGYAQSIRGNIYTDNGVNVCSGSQTLFLDAGWKVCVMSTFRFNPDPSVSYIPTMYFEVFDNLTIEKTYNPENNYLLKTSVDYPIDCDTWEKYLLDRNAEITITTPNGNISGYVNDIERNATTGDATVSILGKFAQSI